MRDMRSRCKVYIAAIPTPDVTGTTVGLDEIFYVNQSNTGGTELQLMGHARGRVANSAAYCCPYFSNNFYTCVFSPGYERMIRDALSTECSDQSMAHLARTRPALAMKNPYFEFWALTHAAQAEACIRGAKAIEASLVELGLPRSWAEWPNRTIGIHEVELPDGWRRPW